MLAYRTLVLLGCDIALAGSGYITSLDTKLKSYILYIGPVSILYILYRISYIKSVGFGKSTG